MDRGDAWPWSKCVWELTGIDPRVVSLDLILRGADDSARAFITRNKPAIMEELRGENTLA